MKGKIKWYHPQKGYGFITPDGDEENDVFVYHDQIRNMEGFRKLERGESVEFEIGKDEQGRKIARNVYRCDS